MKKVAVLQFPGINSEYETRRALRDAGMQAEFFRWNQDPTELQNFDGFVIAGGFSYEDRGRAGLVASMAPIMQAIAEQADQGKPVLGICNGAQILVETGLVPGTQNRDLLLCLARNRRIKDGQLLGTGFYNENVHVKSNIKPNRCAFTLDYEEGEIGTAPAAHGEGRFTTILPTLMDTLDANGQIPFKYCTEGGQVTPDFPTNPNGALNNAAAVCNPAGNVMAIMPHPERAPLSPMHKIFTSMRRYMEGEALTPGPELTDKEPETQSQTYTHKANTIELQVRLIITDNEAQTIQNALNQLGFNVTVNKAIHYEIEHAPGLNQDELAQELIASGELLNTNKETATIITDQSQNSPATNTYLVRDREDSHGDSKTQKIHHHLGTDKVKAIHHGWLWEVTGNFDEAALLATNIFANQHAQVLTKY